MSLEILKGFIILACIFMPLERIFSLHKQKIFRLGWATDATYFFTGHFIGRAGAIVVAVTLSLMTDLLKPELQSKIASQPVWLQFLEAIVISDLAYYIAHRMLHEIPWLWQFHAVHHSIEHMDWLAAVRVHPCEQLLTQICKMMPLYWLGFTKEAFAVYALYSAAIAFLIHANITIKFGPLKWFVATPQFHHWHHSKSPNIHNKNFAVQLPLLDLLFGTLYMPTKKMPYKYGVSNSIPAGYLGQIFYPFMGKMKMLNNRLKPGIDRYFRLLSVILGLSSIAISSLSAMALINHMDIPTFIASWNTQQVTAAQLQQGKLKPAILIDVRSPEEYAEDRIGDSPLVPLIDIEMGFGVKQVKNIVKAAVKNNKSQPIVVLYCARGGRSIKAYKQLEKIARYSPDAAGNERNKINDVRLNVVVLSGGIEGWRQAVAAEKDAEILARISLPAVSSYQK